MLTMNEDQNRQNKLLRLLTPASYGAYCLYMTNVRFKTCGFLWKPRSALFTRTMNQSPLAEIHSPLAEIHSPLAEDHSPLAEK